MKYGTAYRQHCAIFPAALWAGFAVGTILTVARAPIHRSSFNLLIDPIEEVGVSMKIAYVIGAYKLPEQVIRLVDRLDDRDVSFFMHIDKRTEEVFQSVYRALKDRSNVYWVERRPVKWGNFDQILVSLSGIRAICKTNIDFDFVINLSGQDYPIKSNQEITQILSQHTGKQLLEYFALPDKRWYPDGGLERFERYTFWIGARFFRLPAGRFFGLSREKPKFPHGFKPYGGSAWWCLSGECVRYIDEFVRTQIGRDLSKFFEHTWGSSEMFTQTVIMNSPLKETAVNKDLWCIKWPDGSSHPQTLTTEDYEKLRVTERCFARKFDAEIDSDILNLIDRDIADQRDSRSLSEAEQGLKGIPVA